MHPLLVLLHQKKFLLYTKKVKMDLNGLIPISLYLLKYRNSTTKSKRLEIHSDITFQTGRKVYFRFTLGAVAIWQDTKVSKETAVALQR